MGFEITPDYIVPWAQQNSAIVLLGILAAMACAILGNFLVLRKMSMMGDAISHAVLPGLVIGFMITHSRNSINMFIAAAIVGILTALFTQVIHRYGKVDESAAMGVVFTTLFAFGILLIVKFVNHVDLDAECVLYGVMETVALKGSLYEGQIAGIPFLVNATHLKLFIILMINVVFVIVFFKELKITSFDPALATTIGINSQFMHYLLMTLVAITTVAAFEAVGSIMVIAMLIVPAAVAHLLTDKLWLMIVISLIVAVLTAILGHISAITVPPYVASLLVEGGEFIYPDTRTSGMMAVVVAIFLALAVVFSPNYGLISKAARNLMLNIKISSEDLLGLLYRLEEMKLAGQADTGLLLKARGASGLMHLMAKRLLKTKGDITYDDKLLVLTESGRKKAQKLIRSHRLWETYLYKYVNKTMDHLHFPAESLEHITDDDMRQRLAERTEDVEIDPQGRSIPPRQNKKEHDLE